MVPNGLDLEALTEPTRRKIVALLAEHPRRSTSLAVALGVSNATLARHLRLLRAAGVVVADRVVRDGRVRLYMLDPRRARPVMAWLATFGLEDEDAASRTVPTGTWSEPVLVVQAGPYRLALATERTPRVIYEPEVIALPSGRPGIVGVVEVDGRIVPVLDLAKRLGLGATVRDGSARDWFVVETRDGPIVVQVDSATVAGRAEPSDLRAMPDATVGRDGHAIVGLVRLAGRLTVVLDVDALLG
jgi:purine-binding chemotaxis protein CheW